SPSGRLLCRGLVLRLLQLAVDVDVLDAGDLAVLVRKLVVIPAVGEQLLVLIGRGTADEVAAGGGRVCVLKHLLGHKLLLVFPAAPLRPWAPTRAAEAVSFSDGQAENWGRPSGGADSLLDRHAGRSSVPLRTHRGSDTKERSCDQNQQTTTA